jgi:hypothetical protein
MAATEPSTNSSYQFSHVLAAYVIAITWARFLPKHSLIGVMVAVIIATGKEWLIDPQYEHDALGWRNPAPNQDVGGSLQDFTYWCVGAVLAFVLLRWF